jgi:hypothetical protein
MLYLCTNKQQNNNLKKTKMEKEKNNLDNLLDMRIKVLKSKIAQYENENGDTNFMTRKYDSVFQMYQIRKNTLRELMAIKNNDQEFFKLDSGLDNFDTLIDNCQLGCRI